MRELKPYTFIEKDKGFQVAPSRVRELKPWRRKWMSYFAVAPSRVRELKQTEQENLEETESRTLTGAWIETF